MSAAGSDPAPCPRGASKPVLLHHRTAWVFSKTLNLKMALSPQDRFRNSALWTRTEEDVLPKKIAVEEEPSLIQLRMMELRMMEAALLI